MEQIVVDNRYSLVRPLGGGGMAKVYLAHDDVLDRNVAIKLLREQYADDEEFVERFKREAQSAAGLSHAHIVQTYDRGCSEGGDYYIAMEYVPGGTLKDRILRDGALAPAVAAGVAEQIADALSAAHERRVVHRDIKPQNVLVTRNGDVKVTDFGIARAASSAGVTSTSVVLGTAGYMSPEQARGEPVGPASDLYSLGVVLYEMLTGNLPYEAENPMALAMRHVNEPPRSPREDNPEVPQALDAITRRLLAKDPNARYPSADALAHDLARVQAGLTPNLAAEEKTQLISAPLARDGNRGTARTAAQPPFVASPPPYYGAGPRRRSRFIPLMLALILAILLLGGIAWALTRGMDLLPSLGGQPENQPQVEQPQQQDQAESVDVPDVRGLGRDDAVAQLQSAGFQVEEERQESTWEELDTIVEQDPAGGQAEAGSTVSLGIGDGPSVVTVPQLTWEAEAAGTLEFEGLVLGNVEYAPSNALPAGRVIESDPASGTEADRGQTVDIVVSSGPPQTANPNQGGQGANNGGQFGNGNNGDDSGGQGRGRGRGGNDNGED